MPQVFVDTGAWYALLDKTDSCHARAVEFFQSLAHPLVTMNYIADETITLAKTVWDIRLRLRSVRCYGMKM